jgi:MoxR-like ATPase
LIFDSSVSPFLEKVSSHFPVKIILVKYSGSPLGRSFFWIINLNNQLSDWRSLALQFEQQINHTILGQQQAVRHCVISVFARGHVLLEGHVGVGKTTLLRAIAQGLGGDYQRIEGTIDLMPADLIYYTYLDNKGKPQVDPSPTAFS